MPLTLNLVGSQSGPDASLLCGRSRLDSLSRLLQPEREEVAVSEESVLPGCTLHR
jgi:hypothetical protein